MINNFFQFLGLQFFLRNKKVNHVFIRVVEIVLNKALHKMSDLVIVVSLLMKDFFNGIEQRYFGISVVTTDEKNVAMNQN